MIAAAVIGGAFVVTLVAMTRYYWRHPETMPPKGLRANWRVLRGGRRG